MKPEIERKFLLDLPAIPINLDDLPNKEIEQCYLMWNEKGEEIRIRKIGDAYKLTYKSGDGINRMEEEIEITNEQYDQLKPLTAGKRLKKTRYYWSLNQFIVEIDVYSGKAAGLIVAEIEFSSVEEFKSFEPPSWFGDEISQVESYRTRNLAVE